MIKKQHQPARHGRRPDALPWRPADADADESRGIKTPPTASQNDAMRVIRSLRTDAELRASVDADSLLYGRSMGKFSKAAIQRSEREWKRFLTDRRRNVRANIGKGGYSGEHDTEQE